MAGERICKNLLKIDNAFALHVKIKIFCVSTKCINRIRLILCVKHFSIAAHLLVPSITAQRILYAWTRRHKVHGVLCETVQYVLTQVQTVRDILDRPNSIRTQGHLSVMVQNVQNFLFYRLVYPLFRYI